MQSKQNLILNFNLILLDLNSEWVTDAQLKSDPTLGDEGFSETIGCQEPQFHNKQAAKENEDDLRDEILSNRCPNETKIVM
jgi:hypothetical protein